MSATRKPPLPADYVRAKEEMYRAFDAWIRQAKPSRAEIDRQIETAIGMMDEAASLRNSNGGRRS